MDIILLLLLILFFTGLHGVMIQAYPNNNRSLLLIARGIDLSNVSKQCDTHVSKLPMSIFSALDVVNMIKTIMTILTTIILIIYTSYGPCYVVGAIYIYSTILLRVSHEARLIDLVMKWGSQSYLMLVNSILCLMFCITIIYAILR